MKRAIKEWIIVLVSLADDAAVVLLILLVIRLLKIPISLPIIIFIALFFVALAFAMHKLVISALPLVTYEVAVTVITSSNASVSWKTNGDASSQVFYDDLAHDNVTDYAYRTNEDLSLVSAHSMDLTGLSSSTIYHFRVRSTADNITVMSNDKTFATAGGEEKGTGISHPIVKLNSSS
jgi:hypothetical protein